MTEEEQYQAMVLRLGDYQCDNQMHLYDMHPEYRPPEPAPIKYRLENVEADDNWEQLSLFDDATNN